MIFSPMNVHIIHILQGETDAKKNTDTIRENVKNKENDTLRGVTDLCYSWVEGGQAWGSLT